MRDKIDLFVVVGVGVAMAIFWITVIRRRSAAIRGRRALVDALSTPIERL